MLYCDGVLHAWFAVAWTAALHARFRRQPLASANMCWLEALTLLLAARTWLVSTSSTCRIKGDNIAALRLAMGLSSASSALNAIGAELALDCSLELYELHLFEHITGLSNITADALSRLSAKPVPKPMPICCVSEARVTPPDFDTNSFWLVNARRVKK